MHGGRDRERTLPQQSMILPGVSLAVLQGLCQDCLVARKHDGFLSKDALGGLRFARRSVLSPRRGGNRIYGSATEGVAALSPRLMALISPGDWELSQQFHRDS